MKPFKVMNNKTGMTFFVIDKIQVKVKATSLFMATGESYVLVDDINNNFILVGFSTLKKNYTFIGFM